LGSLLVRDWRQRILLSFRVIGSGGKVKRIVVGSDAHGILIPALERRLSKAGTDRRGRQPPFFPEQASCAHVL
jgi:hypothetical protein